MDSRIGLDYIVENREYISKLGAALDTNNTTVKKQVFELLSALCAYNSEGYSRAIETLEYYKNLKNERYRFKIVVNELEKTTIIEYQTALLAFINCVIISAANLQDRLRIRNEFIGLKVLPVLNNLRRVAHNVSDIIVQLDVFEEQRECDEAQSLQGPNGINLNSHLDVFYAILRQVADTPQEIPFLSILQHLLRIDSKESISDVIWDTTEKLVHRATLLENHEDSTRLLRTPSMQKFACPHCRGGGISAADSGTNSNRKQSLIISTGIQSPTNSIHSPPPLSSLQTQMAPPPPPPPPPPLAPPPPAPPIPPPMMMNNSSAIPPPPMPNSLLSNVNAGALNRPKTPESGYNEVAILLPQQDIPVPKSKMKTINWNKIPPNKVIGKRNIWSVVADSHQDSPMADLDWNEMEGLFCLQSTNIQGSPKLGRSDSGNSGGGDTTDRKARKESSEITLLDGKRSLNVNIFLKQFRTSNEDIIDLIKNGQHDDIGAEKLRGLLKILPEVDELDMLRNFDGDKNRLGNAEKFLLQLLKIPNYKLRIESMLLKEEFASNVGYLEPCINSVLYAADDLMNNKMLREVLYMVVVAGNFLNSGGYAGNAAGVKLSSLQKLTDIRANKPGMNLIHFVAMQCEKRNRDLLEFPSQLGTLESATKTTSEQINNEINALDSRIKKIKKQIELPATDDDIKQQMMEFLQAAESEVLVLQRGMKEVDLIRIKLADFFCEDSNTFKIEECLKVFQNFCDKFKQAVKENERRRLLEEQANIRRKQREEQIARRARQLNQCGTPVSDSENSLLLDPSFDPRCSPALSRRRMGSFNSSADGNFLRDDGISPDITPNGSLRRRRSRVLADEDDSNLMEFLRSSGHDNGSRERKASSYGSLDRSWARRARNGTSNKKRPELLNIDFTGDRERPNSPSPLPESKPQDSLQTQHDETKPRISKEWRQKIESWLQANENDEKQNEEYKRRRRLASNRRSLENDSEGERNKLDPLPEEKITINSNGVESYKRVYPDWKPSQALEKTDVVGTIEAIQDVQNNRNKSTWRKSVYNTSEQNQHKDQMNRRTTPPRASPTGSPLQSIDEEDKRKSVIQKLGGNSVSDRLQIYIRRPSEPNEEDSLTKSSTSTSSNSATIPLKSPITTSIDNTTYTKYAASVLDNKTKDVRNNNTTSISTLDRLGNRIRDRHDEKYNRVEIDSDNIETPPVVRRGINGPSTRKFTSHTSSPVSCDSNSQKNKPIIDSQENDEIGHFDRFSAARRTRRYKRPTDYSSGNEDISPTSLDTTTSASQESDNPISSLDKIDSIIAPVDNKDERLKRWQDRLKDLDTKKNIQSKSQNKKVTNLETVGRHMSSINQEDVQEAIRNLKSPTGTPERIWSPPREIITTDTEKKTQPTTIIKISNHELNDEGFEETQSLVSDTPSQGKESTSSCNDNDANQNQKKIGRQKPLRLTSTDSGGTNTSGSDVATLKSRASILASSSRSPIQSLLDRNKRSLERSRSMRNPNNASSSPIRLNTSSSSNSNLHRRASSLRKSDSNTSNVSSSNKRDVERSSSRTSLRSSRSSLNSAISTSTVRKMPIKAHLQTTSVESSPSKRPLSAQNSTFGKLGSRSSSSGSSVGPGARRPPLKTNQNSTSIALSTLGSTSFKENQTSGGTKTAARNVILLNRSISNSPSHSMAGSSNGSNRTKLNPTTRLNFMRPTASSSTKRLQNDGKK